MLANFTPFAAVDIEAALPQIFERQVYAGPERTAVSDGLNSLTYDQLNRWSNRIAHAILLVLGDAEEPVAILFRQSAEAIAATLGTLKAGKIYVPIEPNQSEGELRHIIDDCKPRLIITDSGHETLARSLVRSPDQCLQIETMALGMPDTDPGLQFSPTRVSYIFYTSGTTGMPKGVFDNHRNVLHNIMRYTNTLEIGASDRLSLIQSIGFSGTVSSLFAALLNGAAICPFDLANKGIGRMADWMENQSITIFHSVPTIFEQVLAKRGRFDDLRIVRLEGDRVEPRHIRLFQKHFNGNQILVNGLGTTETGLIRQFKVVPNSPLDHATVPIGHAIDGMDIILADDNGHEVNPGSIGEILVRSFYLASGYWGRKDLTDERFFPDPTGSGRRCYRTGDLGRMRTDGVLEYLGRKDFQTKLRGQWVDMAAVENALLRVESITRTLVTTRDDGGGTQQLVAYLVAEEHVPPIDTLRKTLSQSLPPNMLPSRFVFIDALPEDRNGKIDRRALPAPGKVRPPLSQTYVAPRNREEEMVASCFRQVLQLERVGIQDDFLDLGGDSLLATELFLTLETQIGRMFSPTLTSSSFTVASIVVLLQTSLPESTLVPLQSGAGRAPLFCVHNHAGDISEYRQLIHLLDSDQPVFGIISRAYTKAKALDMSVKDMATAYVREITALQSTGPYHLCGNCFGGVLAFEIARQLVRQGYEVGLLALIDTEFPVGFFERIIAKITHLTRRRSFGQLPARKELSFFIDGSLPFDRLLVIRSWRSLIGNLRRSEADKADGMAPSRTCVREQNHVAMARYKPRRYMGAMVLICVGPPQNERGWIKMAKAGCQIIEVPPESRIDAGSRPHLTSEPYVSSLANHISKLLAAFT